MLKAPREALQSIGWLKHVAGLFPAAALAANSVPEELQGNADGIVSYLSLCRQGVGRRHCTLILVGPQNVGKTSLLWRLQNPAEHQHNMPTGSTQGIAMGKRRGQTRASHKCNAEALYMYCTLTHRHVAA